MAKTLSQIVFLMIIMVTLTRADEIEELKIEIQELKEKIANLNNRIPVNFSDGLGFSIGVITGLYNEDHVYGLEFSYYFKNRFGICLDLHFLGDNQQNNYLLVALPSLGILNKSPVFHNCSAYGGWIVGITQETNLGQRGPYLHLRGFGGIEFLTSKLTSFFIEFGGGGVVNRKNLDYTRGTLILGGTKFYF